MKRNKGLSLLLLLVMVLLIAPASFEGATTSTSASTDGWQTLEGSDIQYRYGLTKTEHSRSYSYSSSFNEVTDERGVDVSFRWPVSVYRGIEEKNLFWYRFVNKTRADPQPNWTLQGGWGWNKTVGNFTGLWDAWFRYHGITVLNWTPLQQLIGFFGFIGLAGTGWHTSYVTIEEVENVTIPKWDWLRRNFGSANETVRHLYYWYDNNTPGDTADDEVVFEELLIPVYRFLVEKYDWPVWMNINSTIDYAVSLSGSWNLSGTYDETVWGHDVEIKLPGNYHLGYRAIENATGTYSLSGGFSYSGSISLNTTTDVKYDNGTELPENLRPKWLRSSNNSAGGSWSFNYAEDGEFFGVGALQGIIQGVLTKLSNESVADLLIWGGWKPNRMIGYLDEDGNNRLDVKLVNSLIESPDSILALGLPEGLKVEGDANSTATINAYTLYQDVFKDERKDLLNTTTSSKDFSRVHGFDPEIYSGTTTLSWDTPSYDSVTGKATFGWTVARDDWPVWWIATNETVSDLVVIETMDLEDSYDLEIDTVAGIATLENEYKQSAITNDTLADMTADLSLATYTRDLFLSASLLEKGMDGAISQDTDLTEFKVGGVSIATAAFGGTKATYTVGGSTNTTQTTVLNLLTMSGQIGDNSSTITSTGVNPYVSPLARRVALHLVHITAHGLGDLHGGSVNWLLSENIVVTSYPEWGGANIVHDPTYTATFTPKAADESSQTGTTSEEPSTSAAASAAGIFVIGSLLVSIGVIRRRLRK